MRLHALWRVSDEARLERARVRTHADTALPLRLEKGGVSGLTTGQRKQESESPPGFLAEGEGDVVEDDSDWLGGPAMENDDAARIAAAIVVELQEINKTLVQINNSLETIELTQSSMPVSFWYDVRRFAIRVRSKEQYRQLIVMFVLMLALVGAFKVIETLL